MKFILTITLLLSSLFAIAAEKKTEVFTLDHQMSQHCEKKIKENLRFEKGIYNIEVSLKANTITITYNPQKTDTEKIIEAFKKIGFTAFLVNNNCVTPDCEIPDSCCAPTPVQPCCTTPAPESCCGIGY